MVINSFSNRENANNWPLRANAFKGSFTFISVKFIKRLYLKKCRFIEIFILLQVVANFAIFMTAYTSILIAFALAFNILLDKVHLSLAIIILILFYLKQQKTN